MSVWRVGRAVCQLLLVTVVALAATASTASADPDERAGVFKLTFAGYASITEWASCPDPASEELGTLCTGGYVMVFRSSGSEQAGSEFHLRDKTSGVIRIFDYTCLVSDFELDPGQVERVCLPQVERFGRATDVDVAVDPQLDATAATAAVPVQIVDFVEGTETTGTVDVVAAFQGIGSTTRIDEREHFADRYVMWREGTRGWERGCIATVTLDAEEVPVGWSSCSMSRVRQTEMRVFHNTPA